MYCNNCDAELDEKLSYCEICSAQVKNQVPVYYEKSEVNDLKNNGINKLALSTSYGLHPWRRLFARTLDLQMTGVILFLLALLPVIFFDRIFSFISADFLDSISKIPDLFFIVIYYFLWTLIEAFFISRFTTTPGKWIFGISVVSENENKLPYFVALDRAVQVWARGDGLGIPIVTLFTRILAYQRLKTTRSTFWDDYVGSVVIHKEWSSLRWLACTLIILFSYSTLFYFALAEL